MTNINVELYYVVRSFSRREGYDYIAGPFATYLEAYREIEDNRGIFSSAHYHVAKRVVDMELL